MKNNQKCIRISDKTLEYIEGFPGVGFNQKLENMVRRFMETENDLIERIAYLEDEQKRLTENVSDLKGLERSLSEIKRYVDYAKGYANKAPLKGQLKIV